MTFSAIWGIMWTAGSAVMAGTKGDQKMDGSFERRHGRHTASLPQHVMAEAAAAAAMRGQSLDDFLTVAVLLHVRSPRSEAVLEAAVAALRTTTKTGGDLAEATAALRGYDHPRRPVRSAAFLEEPPFSSPPAKASAPPPPPLAFAEPKEPEAEPQRGRLAGLAAALAWPSILAVVLGLAVVASRHVGFADRL